MPENVMTIKRFSKEDMKLNLVISVDVEEEGLFCGRYSQKPTGVTNVAHLRRMEFVSREFGFPLTLLATYSVVGDSSCRDLLLFWRDCLHAEIGVHLHPWNTPPFEKMPWPEPVSSDLIPLPLLSAKLESLMGALQENMQVVPRAFRMGRFDLGAQVCTLLSHYGFQVDSSIVPLRSGPGGLDSFLAPPDPFRLLTSHGHPPLLEVPLTMIPIWERSSQMVHRLARRLPCPEAKLILSGFRHAAVLGIHPTWYPLASMKLCAHLHQRRGGRVLHMFMHSSELAPGATPRYRGEASVRRLVRKIGAFLDWLVRNVPVEGLTLSDLCHTKNCFSVPYETAAAGADQHDAANGETLPVFPVSRTTP
jgi:hypothetical protein